MVCTDPYFVQNLRIILTPQSLCCIEMFCNAFKKFERTLMVVRNINLGTWLEQKEWERWKGGNGGKFQERESATWEGGWVCTLKGAPGWHLWVDWPRPPVDNLLLCLPTLPPQLTSPPCSACFMRSKEVSHTGWVTDEHPFQLVINIFLVGTSFLLLITLLHCYKSQRRVVLHK